MQSVSQPAGREHKEQPGWTPTQVPPSEGGGGQFVPSPEQNLWAYRSKIVGGSGRIRGDEDQTLYRDVGGSRISPIKHGSWQDQAVMSSRARIEPWPLSCSLDFIETRPDGRLCRRCNLKFYPWELSD